ncbi:MAG: diguanylate cyclase [Deltaproteobacteria bacterium]|nr:diguanylate cyclase [Deltaproteobacteria bacterium]
MKQTHFFSNRLHRVKTYVIGGAVLWTIIIGSSLLWNIHYTEKQTLAKSDVIGRLAFDKDESFRLWVTYHGGVYVPVTESTKSNPYLNVPDKDIWASQFRQLTLMNPAYVMRQFYEQFEKKGGVKGHITSLRPLRPENKPDPWEEQALRAFEAGWKEETIIQALGGTEYVRFMKPFVVTKGCLKCHAMQGYREGDIRGGISVSVPMAPLRQLEQNNLAMLSQVHAVLWGLGLAGIVIFGKMSRRSEDARLLTEQDLRMSEEKLAKVFQASPDWITITTLDDIRYVDVNNAFECMTGFTRDETIGRNADELGLWVNSEQREIALTKLQEQRALHNFEVDLRMKSGRTCTMLWSAESIDLKGQKYLVNAVKDITKRKEMEEEIKRIAYHDALTGLPNRTLMMDHMTLAMHQAERSGDKAAIMMLDLDKFKEVNDTMGHTVGDLLLRAVAARLTGALRKADTVARFGGDEFVIVVPGQKNQADVSVIARKIMDSFKSPFILEERELTITASIGIALYPDHGKDVDVLLKCADRAMYQAKEAGRSGFYMYSGNWSG